MEPVTRKIGVYFLVLLFFPLSLLALPDTKANSIISQVVKKYEDSKNIKVNFLQLFYWKLTDNKAEQSGTIWLEGKEKFKILTDNQLIISDGNTIWTFSKTTNQVIVDNLQSAEDVDLPKDILLNFSDKYHAEYIQDEKIDGIDFHLIKLTSKTEENFVREMRIWIDIKEKTVNKIEQLDLNNNTNTYLLRDFIFNVDLGAKFFKFEIPDSVEVIDMR